LVKTGNTRGMKYNTKKFILKDKKGHKVFRVYTRKDRTENVKAIPYLYCQKCDLFFTPKILEKVNVDKN
jgi:hypothetical protein